MRHILGSILFGICIGLIVFITLQEMVILPLPLVLFFHMGIGFILAYLIIWIWNKLDNPPKK